ncbi:MAG: DMT family transporter [Parvularculaceae bacterium]
MAANSSVRTRAIAYATLGVALLCFMDGVIKHLIANNDALVVTFGRYVFGVLFAALIWLQAGSPKVTREMWRAHAARGVVIAMSATSFFWSLTVLPLAEVIVIAFIAPLLIPFVARALLGERLRPRNIMAGVIGFGGVAIASVGAPAIDGDATRTLGVIAVLFSAVTYALSITLLRGRAGRDGAAIVGLLASLIPGAIIAVPAFATGEWPAIGELPAFIGMGALAAAGMYCLTKAYAEAEAQVLAPLEYTALIWAALIGWFLFAEPVRGQVWIGAAIIIAACLWGAREEKALSPATGAAP